MIRTLAEAGWASAAEYPSVYAMTFARTTGREAERELVELLLSTLVGAGLPHERAALVYRVIADTLLALSGAQATFDALDPRAREKDLTAWTRIYAVLPGETYPETRHHAAELIQLSDEDVFRAAIDMLIVAIEAQLP